MNGIFSRKVTVLLVIVQLLLVSAFVLRPNTVTGQGTRTFRLLDDATGSSSIALGNASESMPIGGIPFTIALFLDGSTTDLATWQAGLTFDNNSLLCTSALVPKGNSSYVFFSKQDISVFDLSHQNYYIPQIVGGATLLDPTQAVTVDNALLCILNFTALKLGNATISFLDITQTFLQDSNALDIRYETPANFTVSVVGTRSPPVASFTLKPEAPKANQTITFDASSSYDPDGDPIQNYTWDLGDNTTITEQVRFTYNYTNSGVYRINLTVVDTDNFTDSAVKELSIGSPPNATFTHTPDIVRPTTTGYEPVTFNASESSDADGFIVSYFWIFGDGTNQTMPNATITHNYAKRGVYQVNLTATDNDGLSSVFNATVQIGVPPNPLFTFTPETPFVKDIVTFEASGTASELGVSLVAYQWDFEDTGTRILSNSSTVTYIFYTDTNWTVTLTLYDSDGLFSTYSKTVSVYSQTEAATTNWTNYIIASVIVVIIVVALVIRRLRRKSEEALDI